MKMSEQISLFAMDPKRSKTMLQKTGYFDMTNWPIETLRPEPIRNVESTVRSSDRE